jgi:hypothetical protein
VSGFPSFLELLCTRHATQPASFGWGPCVITALEPFKRTCKTPLAAGGGGGCSRASVGCLLLFSLLPVRACCSCLLQHYMWGALTRTWLFRISESRRQG